jgi:hypothetical protein
VGRLDGAAFGAHSLRPGFLTSAARPGCMARGQLENVLYSRLAGRRTSYESFQDYPHNLAIELAEYEQLGVRKISSYSVDKRKRAQRWRDRLDSENCELRRQVRQVSRLFR